MGRLDDIAQRNRKASSGDGLLVKAVAGAGTDQPDADAAPFTLPSQRRSGPAVWKVLVVMAVLIFGGGYWACRQAERDMAIDRENQAR